MASSAGVGSATAGGSTSERNSSSGSLSRDDSKWYFTSEQLANSPSRKCGMDADQELMYRQRAANLIQDMGQRLQVSQLCINTAIVYMHRFYAFHSFTQFHRNSIAAAALFLAAKVEEQPRKLEHIIKVVHVCLQLEVPDPLKESYAEQAQDLVFNENVLLQTLGFDVAIDHPHTHVVKTCHLVKASKDLAQTSYFMASNSLHLTTMCLQYKPTVVACFCIHLACKWSRWEIPQSNEGRHWFHYVDKTVTLDLLKQLTDEFLHIFDRCPTRLKSKMKSIRADQAQTDDSNRRSSSNSSGLSAPSSSIPRGIDDAGSSSSSHHRSTSHSQHSHSKQSSGDQMAKAQPSSSNHKIPTSSSSSTSRSRADRPSSSQQQQLHQQQMMASSGHYSASSSSGKMQPLQHHISNRSGIPLQSSSSRSGYAHDTSRDSKGRMPPAGASGSAASSIQAHSYGQTKMDRHGSSSTSSQKGQPIMVHMDSKNPMSKSQSSMMSSLFNSGSDSRTMKQPQTSYGSHPPSYSQSISNRNNSLPSNEPVTVPTQQQPYKNQLQQQLSAGSDSSFRLIDDSSRISDPMQLCTPPKQSKPSSIFSPDWKDTQTESSNSSLPNTASGSKSRTQGHSAGMNSGLIKPIKESPSSKDKKQVVQTFMDYHTSKRSETPKKERRNELVGVASGSHQNQKAADKKPSMSSLKRSSETSSTTITSNPLPVATHDPVDLMDISKVPSTQTAGKRSLPNSEQVRQEDGTDFRESKIRKMESTSPSEQLFTSTFDLSNTFDKQDDGFSLFSFGDPGSLLSQPLLSDSKPVNIGSKGSFSNTINGIETNPALVSSLLKESLCSNDSKFALNSGGNASVATTSNAPMVTGNETTEAGIMSSLTTGVPTSGTSLMSTSSIPATAAVLSNVPEIVKTETSSMDNTPSTISSLLGQPTAPVLPAVPTSMPTTVASGTATAATVGSEMRNLIGESSKDEEQLRSKSEKKKKKDKHKHKEKDKSKDKDREDRKKHKKDKERHRDRDKSDLSSDPSLVSPTPGPIKIKLPKDKLNLPSLSDSTAANNAPASDTGLKIKIPKDRLSGSSSLAGSASGPATSGGSSAIPVQAPNPLKLKISKDKIEHYNISTGGDSGFNNGSGHGNPGAHHSSKKKERDKDRDKNKTGKSSTSSSSGDYSKQNGNVGSSAASQGSNTSNKSSSHKLSVPSAQQQQHSLYNANQLGASQAGAGSISHHPASFDYMQHAQAPTLQQQQQYFNQFGTFNVQQQQQMLINNSAIKMPGSNLGTALPPYYYGSNNPNNGGSSGKK